MSLTQALSFPQAFAVAAVTALLISFGMLPSMAQDDNNKPVTAAEARKFVADHAPEKAPRRGVLPPGFMLTFTDPGCEPGGDCDDVGTWHSIRNAFAAQAGSNMEYMGVGWGSTEKKDPGDGASVYDFSGVSMSERTRNARYVICGIDFFGNPWAEEFRFTDIPRYNALLERWAEAACRYVNEKFGVTMFMTGGNERDLVAPETYRPHFQDWHYFYMDPVKAIHRGMKKASEDNKLVIGNMCYTDRDHIGAMYQAGAKGHFEVLAIHAYGPHGSHVDMEQILEAHEGMAAEGDGHIPIILTEGWSSLPLPSSLEGDPVWRGGTRPYTDAEIEHYRQSVLDGWRNLTTERPGMYDPSWVIGAHYFVLNDHWGGRGWEARATPQKDDNGNLKGFLLDGYFIGTSDPNFVKPLMRPWGLIDIEGKPKGDTIYGFPPYIPKHKFTARLDADLPSVSYVQRQASWTAPEAKAAHPYRVFVEFTNNEASPMTECRWTLSEKSEKDYPGGYAFAFVQGELHIKGDPSTEHLVKSRPVGKIPPDVIEPGETVRLEYEVIFSPELDTTERGDMRKRVRPLVDLYYVWEGRPYHTDAWLPRVVVKKD